jgi:hypothetical protein
MEDLRFERVHGRPIRLFLLSRWEWIEPEISPFTLLVAARADDDEISKIQIRRFATDAVASGCGSVNTWVKAASWFTICSITRLSRQIDSSCRRGTPMCRSRTCSTSPS